MRLFIAVELNDDVRAAAAKLIAEMRHRTTAIAPRSRVTWVAPDRLHVTIRFIGETDAERVPAIERALAPGLEIRPFEIHLVGTGVFPAAGPPRVIWLGLTDRAGLDDLHRAVSARLATAGRPPDTRPFSPHLTLGRVRDAAGLRGARLIEGLADIDLGRLPVTRAVLVESHLSSRGPDYSIRLAMPLAG